MCTASIDTGGKAWQAVSAEAISLLTALLKKDPRARMDLDGIRASPWLAPTMADLELEIEREMQREMQRETQRWRSDGSMEMKQCKRRRMFETTEFTIDTLPPTSASSGAFPSLGSLFQDDAEL